MEEKLESVRREYGSTLSDLKINSKPHINTLTTLAEEYVPYASEVVRLIENRLQKAPSNEKLPVMYLMDSIVKNVKKGPYQQLFAKNLTNNFCGVFAKVNEKTRASLFKLRSTWNQYFPGGILNALDVRVQKIDPAWPIMTSSTPTAPAPSIHINPKFIKKPAPMESTAAPTVPVQAPSTVVTSDLSDKDRVEQEMRQSLISKQQELLQIQQQRLELELEQTKARLELQARELAAKNQALEEQQMKISQMATNSQAPTAPTSALPITSVPGAAGLVPQPLLQPSGVPTNPPAMPLGKTSTAGIGLLGEAPTQKFSAAPGGLLGVAPGINTNSSLVSQASVSAPSLPNVSAVVQSQGSRNTINPRDPRLARDPRLRQAFEQQQQRQQQEQLLLLQQKKQHLQQQQQLEQQQQQLEQQQLISNIPPSTTPAVGVQPPVSTTASASVSATPAATLKQPSTSGLAGDSKTVSKRVSPKKPGKGKTGAKVGVKLDHLDLSGNSKSKEESKTERNVKPDAVKKGKSQGDKAAERDAPKKSLRPSSSRNYRKTTKEDKEEKMRSDSRTSRKRSTSDSPSHSVSRSRSRSRSRSPRSGPSSPRASERRERERRVGKTAEIKRKDSKENKPEIKEKRKSPSPDRTMDEEKSASKKYSKQDQLPPKKRARLIEKEQQEAERERERTSRAIRSRSERERAAGWTRTETRDHTADQRPPRRPSLLDPNIKIPKELSLSKLAKVLEQAEKQLNSGALTHEQHQQLLRELNEIYNIQQQKREEEERYNRRGPPPPEWGPHNARDLRDPRMMRDPRAQRDPRAYNGPPRDVHDPRHAFVTRGPPDNRDGPPFIDSRPPQHRRDFVDPRDPRAMQDPMGPPQQDGSLDPRHRSLLEDPRMKKFASHPDGDEGGRKGPLLQDPGAMPDPRLRIRLPPTEDDPVKGNMNPGMDVDERKPAYRQYRGPLDEKLPLPISPRDTDERDLKQFAEMGDTDLRKLPPGPDVQSKMDVDYRVLPAAFQSDVKENIKGIGDTDERQRVKAEDSDERKIPDDSDKDKPSEEPSKPTEEGERMQTPHEIAPSAEMEKESKMVTKVPIRSGAKAEWEAAAKKKKLDEDVDMRPKSKIKKLKKMGSKDEDSKPATEDKPEQTSMPIADNSDKDERQKVDEPSQAMKETSSSDTDERKFPAKSEITEIEGDDKVDDMDLPSDDVDLRQLMPRQEEGPNMGYPGRENLMDNDYRQRPFMGPGPPHFRQGPGKWQTWKKEHPDEVSAPHFEEGPEGFAPNDPRHPMHPVHWRRGRDPRAPFEGDMPPMDPRQQRYKDSPPMEVGEDFQRFRDGDGPPPLERQDFRMEDGPPMDEGDFPSNRDPRDPGMRRNGPVRLARQEQGFDEFPPDIAPADTPQSPEPEERLPPMYCLGPNMKRPGERPSPPLDDRESRPLFQPRDGPSFRGPRPEGVMPRRPEGENPRDSPPFRGPRPDGRDMTREGMMPRPMRPDGPRFMGGPRGPGDMPRFPGDMQGPGGPRQMGPRIRPDGPMRGPHNQFRPRSNSPPVSDMQRQPRNGPASNLPNNILSNVGNLQQIVQSVSQQVLQNLRGQMTDQQQQQAQSQIPAHNLIRSALQSMGVRGSIPDHVLQDAQNKLLEQMRSMPNMQNMNMNMLRMIRPQQPNMPNQRMERPPMPQGPGQQQPPRGPPGMQPRPRFPPVGMPPNSMQQGFPQGMRPPQILDQPEVPNQGIPPQGMPPQGMPPQGMPPQGMPPQGMPPQGMPPQGMRPQGMPPQGMPQGQPPQGQPLQGMPPRGMHPRGMPQQGMPPQGMPPHGMPQQGMPPQGMPQQGMPQQGIPPQGMAPPGMPPQGIPSQGMPPQGMPPQGMPPQGMPQQGMSQQRMSSQGMPQQGMPPQGIPPQGIRSHGMPMYLAGMPHGKHPGMMSGPQGPIRMPQGGPGGPGPQPTAPPAPGLSSQLDINSLFSKLISSGILKEPLKPASPHPEQTAALPTAAAPEMVLKEGSEAEGEKEEDKDSQEIEDDGIYDIPEMSLVTEELKARHPGIVKRMYSGMQCTSCGQRFVIAQMDRYRKHLDWHFRQNRKKQDGIKATTSRKWYYEVDEWLDYEEINDMEDARSTFFEEQAQEFAEKDRGDCSVPVTSDPSDEICKICRENFEQFFNEETEEWHFRNAIRVEGKTFHPSCYDDVKDTSGFLETPTDDLLSPPLVRTRNSFSGTPVSPGASSSKRSFIAPGKESWDAVMGPDEKPASTVGADVKVEPKIEVDPSPAGNVGEDTSKTSALVKVKLEPEESMDSEQSMEGASSSNGTQIKIEPSEDSIKSEPVGEEEQTALQVKQEPEADIGVSQAPVEKEQMRQEEMKSSLDAFRAKSSPVPFLEEVSPEKMEVTTDSAPSEILAEVASTEASTEAEKTVTSVPSEDIVPTDMEEQAAVIPSGSGDKSVESDPLVQPPADDGHIPKKLPLSEAVATLRESEVSAEPPVLEVEAPLSSTNQDQGKNNAQSPSLGIFEKLTPAPALTSIESEDSQAKVTPDQIPADMPVGAGDANPNAGDTQESSM